MAYFQKTILQIVQTIFCNPKGKLKAPSLEESKKQCKKIKATLKEIREGKKMVSYICEDCDYHQGKSLDGKIRRCSVCGGWLKYNPLWIRILEERN